MSTMYDTSIEYNHRHGRAEKQTLGDDWLDMLSTLKCLLSVKCIICTSLFVKMVKNSPTIYI